MSADKIKTKQKKIDTCGERNIQETTVVSAEKVVKKKKKIIDTSDERNAQEAAVVPAEKKLKKKQKIIESSDEKKVPETAVASAKESKGLGKTLIIPTPKLVVLWLFTYTIYPCQLYLQ
jgi:hypothetical protein